MTSDTLAPATVHENPATAAPPERWSDEIWTMVVGSFDAVLRSHYDVHEFTGDPACVLRLGRSPARTALSLSDGSEIDSGEAIGTVHLWNEHLPRFPREGPDLRWAASVHRRLVASLQALAEYVETDPEWPAVRAFRAETALSSRLGLPQLRRVAGRYGFECPAAPTSMVRHLHAVGECFMAWGLARAFNPEALPRQRFFRARRELWIARSTLVGLYGRRH